MPLFVAHSSLSSSLPPSLLLLSPHLSHPLSPSPPLSLPLCVSLSVVRKLQEFELPYVSISSLQSSDFHILLRKRYSPPAPLTAFTSNAPTRLFVIFGNKLDYQSDYSCLEKHVGYLADVDVAVSQQLIRLSARFVRE